MAGIVVRICRSGGTGNLLERDLGLLLGLKSMNSNDFVWRPLCLMTGSTLLDPAFPIWISFRTFGRKFGKVRLLPAGAFNSPIFGPWVGEYISEVKKRMLWVPAEAGGTVLL